ncbi:MAG: hypothetical protein SFW36_14270 [Leptolyngbyaceae cyanobacterium bins.59]|nr:hypothetical protein [Leptolyngbyaceae cyanobacterium bins.59]
MVGKFNFFGSKQSPNGEAKPKVQKRRGYYLELAEDAEDLAQVEATPASTIEPQPATPSPLPSTSEVPVPQLESVPKPAEAKKSVAKVPSPPVESTPAPSITFAPNFLLPLSNNTDRRRPGPSLNPFMEMARQMKRPE